MLRVTNIKLDGINQRIENEIFPAIRATNEHIEKNIEQAIQATNEHIEKDIESAIQATNEHIEKNIEAVINSINERIEQDVIVNIQAANNRIKDIDIVLADMCKNQEDLKNSIPSELKKLMNAMQYNYLELLDKCNGLQERHNYLTEQLYKMSFKYKTKSFLKIFISKSLRPKLKKIWLKMKGDV